MIKLVPKFSQKQIEDLIKAQKDRAEAAILMALRRAGELFVKNARENGSYTDRSGNLRSSAGYIIVKNGTIIEENFRSVGKGKKEGPEVGRRVAGDIARKYRSGYALIGVAGMDYAAAVESRGFEVITSSSKVAENNLIDSVYRIARKLSA